MNITQLTIKLIILLIPGIYSTLIIENLTVHKKWSNFKFIIYSILLGCFSYLTLQTILHLCAFIIWMQMGGDFNPPIITFWKSLFDEKTSINGKEVIETCILSTFLAFFVAFIVSRKYLHKISQYLKISTKYGDENLFSFFLNSKDVSWIHIRDKNKQLIYEGLVSVHSETDYACELVLEDVKIYDYENSNFIYAIDSLYLRFPITELSIEVPESSK